MRCGAPQGRGRNVAAALAALVLMLSAPSFAQEPKPEDAAAPVAGIPDEVEPEAAAGPPDFETRWTESAGAFTPPTIAEASLSDQTKKAAPRRGTREHPGITILQIGDSHTAADFFTGELRRRLQALFGNGGPGYIQAGKPHAGVRSSVFRVSTTAGWTYKSLNRATDPTEFWLSGYNTITSESGQTLSFAAESHVPFDAIEIETVRQPGGGKIDIKLDGRVESQYDLTGDKIEPVIIRLVPDKAKTHFVKNIEIATTSAGTTNIASMSVYNRRAGLSYNAVGFPGAEVRLLDKFDERVLASELTRIAPHVVVLAFGTNEGFRDDLDVTAYAATYERVVARIQAILPKAVIVVVSPPDARRTAPQCKDKPAICKPRASTSPSESGECLWRTPPQLDRVREIQAEIAKRLKLVYWDWASIMPEECGAHKWANASPPLMAKDHVHFTIDGYKKSAGEFLNVLIPVIRELRARSNVVSNN